MALTLKGSGLATNLVICVAVDDNNTTIKEFVQGHTSGSGFSTSGTITTGTTSWRSSGTVGKWSMSNNARIQFTSNRTINNANGFSVYAAIVKLEPWTADTGADQALVGGISTDVGAWFAGTRATTSKMMFSATQGGYVQESTNTVPYDNSTAWSWCGNLKNNTLTTGYHFYNANESTADLSANGSGNVGNSLYSTAELWAVGNVEDNQDRPFQGELAIVAVFDKQLSQAEFDTLHDDWRGVLFDAPASSKLLLQTANQMRRRL